MNKKLLTLVTVFALIVATIIPAFATNENDKDTSKHNDFKSYNYFSDVPESHYAYQAIMNMKSYGIIAGYKDGTFKPNATVSREEFATMMVNALQLHVNKKTTSSFEDMKASGWAIPYVEAAKPYLTGYKTSSGFRFKPLDPSVREDMAVALVKALNKPLGDVSLLSDYADLNLISANLRPYVAAAVQSGLMVGTIVDGKKYFNPLTNLSRAEAAQLLMNVIDEEKIIFDTTEDKIIFDDIIYLAPVVTVNADPTNYKLLVSWNTIKTNGIQGYKIVASKNDSTPMYPQNGYYKWITNLDTSSQIIQMGDAYYDGDFSKFESGHTYYISVTAIYKDKAVPGNTIVIKMP